MLNTFPWWEEAWANIISKGKVVRHLQWQGATCLKSGGFSLPNNGKSKDLDIYTTHCLCVKWWTHLHQNQCGYNVQGPWMISSQSRTNYKQKSKSSFTLLLVVLLPTSNYAHITPIRYSAPPFFWQEYSQMLRVKQDINMNQKMKTHSGAQQSLQIYCAYPNTTKYWKWWTRVKECWGGITR